MNLVLAFDFDVPYTQVLKATHYVDDFEVRHPGLGQPQGAAFLFGGTMTEQEKAILLAARRYIQGQGLTHSRVIQLREALNKAVRGGN